jgi:hypothetical protein
MQPARSIAIRKRTQIAKENRKMFLWVAGASVIFGVALVIAIFLVQVISFNQKVINEKSKTNETLIHNNNVVDELQQKVMALDANQALIDSKANLTDDTLQVVLDALPSEPNSLALGASLQNKLLAGISGLTLNSLQVTPIQGVESLSNTVSDVSSTANEINFTFSISGNETALKSALINLERSIRTIDLVSVKIENQGQMRVLTAIGRAYYEPALTVGLKDKVIKQ